MEIKEYIKSGILEAYVLGHLSRAEEMDVVRMVEVHPEIAQALDKVENTLQSMAEAQKAKPSSKVLMGALKQIAQEQQTREPARVVPLRKEAPPENHVPETGTTGFSAWRYAAGIALAISLTGNGLLGFLYYEEHDQRVLVQQQLSNLQDEQTMLANQLNIYQTDYSELKSGIAMINDAQTRMVRLGDPSGTGEKACVVFWNASKQEVYLSVDQLPQIREDQDFQLWALVDGNPVDAGVFEQGDAFVRMKNIDRADAFAVTVEPKGGKPQPTLAQLQVIGEVS